MADSPVRSTSPVNAPGGFAGRANGGTPPRSQSRPQASTPPAADRVTVVHGAMVALRLLRERVLARTRGLLELGEDVIGHEFAEMLDGEPAPAFLGRLLSAQNLLAARRAGSWPGARVRACLDEALRGGAEETLELLAADGHADPAAVAIVAEVLTDYGRRLAALVAEDAERQP